MTPFTFNSSGARLAGQLHGSGKQAIVVMGSWNTVKEQMATVYAKELAEAGFAALTFDFRGFGESSGDPRDVESARVKAEDIRNAIAFAARNHERVGVLAVCASASYTALALEHATPASSGVRAVAMVAPWIHDRALIDKLYGGPDAVAKRLTAARTAREQFATTGEIAYVPAASSEDTSAAMFGKAEEIDYYLNAKRGKIAAWSGRFATMGWTEWLEADFVALAPQFQHPLCIVTGPKTATPDGAKRFVAKLPSAPTVHEHPSATQYDFYDQPDAVKFATQRAVEHFGKAFQ